jgi:hypothetical protein
MMGAVARAAALPATGAAAREVAGKYAIDDVARKLTGLYESLNG